MFNLFIVAIFALLALPGAQSHAIVHNIKGANGVTSTAFGISPGAARIGQVKRVGNNCGLNNAQLTNAIRSTGNLPTAKANGQVDLTFFQFNGDGAGPVSCRVDAKGNGQFQNCNVVKQVPGNGGTGGKSNTDHAATIQLPNGIACSAGPNKNACVVQVKNPRGFGGCFAVTKGGANLQGKGKGGKRVRRAIDS
ncbi:hypothetical protein BJ742DRAFT_140699 [Cladochytrium replicatum]|nr:hypothetical protein BJ742DRAFT_140699 [Cladochytrium replicatum]